MAFNTIPGQQGFMAATYSSMDRRAIGKFTDTNHLSSLVGSEPAMYDKQIISIYTQSSLFSNDFIDMINKSTPYYIRSNSDSWQWKVSVPYDFVKLVAIPETTANNPTPGIDGQEFELVFDRAYFQINDIITAHRMHGDSLAIVSDPLPYNGSSYLYRVVLTKGTSANKYWLQEGFEYEKIDHNTGEFDQELSGLDKLGDEIVMFDSLSAGYGVTHKNTKWADQRVLRDKKGNPLDVIAYAQYRRNEIGRTEILGVRWEPYIEMLLRREMLSIRTKRMLWGQGGVLQTRGSRGEVKKVMEGIYPKMRRAGNYVPYPRGTFNFGLLRDVFGDLFYRRTDFADRRVKLFTNEAGIMLFRQATKEDLYNSGLTLMMDIKDYKQDPSVYNVPFDMMFSMETGKVEVSHLKELDLPQTNAQFGQNKMSPPVFFVFDITNPDGGLQNNIREVRQEGAPSMTWGWVDGREHHLGFAASQGMQSASMEPGYKMWMEDRSDIFIEDLSRCVIIEEIPAY